MARRPGREPTFYEVLTEAVNDILSHGYDSVRRVEGWTERLRAAARRTAVPDHVLEAEIARQLGAVYARAVVKGDVFARHQGVSRFTREAVKPKLLSELDRRRAASASLIRLHRETAVADVERRFSGWASSVPAGGTDAPFDRVDEKARIRKPLSQLPFEERRVLIDQSHKLVASVSDVIAQDGGAIAARWRSHFRQPGYNYREDHKERDGLVYLIRDSWAHRAGLVKPGEAGYTDQIDGPSVAPYCRCFYVFLYSVRRLPDDMVTAKGRMSLQPRAA